MAVELEEITVEEIASEEEDKHAGVPLYRILSYPADYTLQVLYEKWKDGELIIPRFQRSWVWSHTQASKLIESFLMGLPVPAIFLYKERTEEKHLVIDGHQRLITVASFFDGILPDGVDFYLKGVSPQWEGKRYDDLEDSERRRLRDSVLRAVVIEQFDPRDDTSVYHIFERLNTGGTSLTPQEIRNSSYHGAFNDFIVNLNSNPVWRQIVGLDKPDRRMRDVELLVRFFALYKESNSYTKPMKEFLNKFMADHRFNTDNDPFRAAFESIVERVTRHLGPRPFHIKRGINAAVFDSVMVAVARSTSEPPDISERYSRLLANPSYVEATTSATTDVDTVKRRLALAQEILFS